MGLHETVSSPRTDAALRLVPDRRNLSHPTIGPTEPRLELPMAKLFYTQEEASVKLGKSQQELDALVKLGKLREFRDPTTNNLIFKVAEVDLISSDSEAGLSLSLASDLPTDSDSFELDLSDSDETDQSTSGKSSSPIGLQAIPSEASAPLELDFDLDSDLQTTPIPAPADDLAISSEPTLELDLDLGGSEASGLAAASAASGSAPNKHEEPLGLDFSGSSGSIAPAGSAVNASPEQGSAPAFEQTLELDLGGDEIGMAGSKAPRSNNLEDSLGSVGVAPQSIGDLGATDDLSLESPGAMGSNTDSNAGSSISDRVTLDGPGSGSGLMDLTSDSESSSIGAALMDEAFASDDNSELPANASGIFGGEGAAAGGESGAGMPAAAVAAKAAGVPIFTSAPVTAEVYSGTWSGLAIGLLLPSFLALIAAAAMVVMKNLGATPEFAVMYAQDVWMFTGGLAGVIAVSGVIGFFVGKATE